MERSPRRRPKPAAIDITWVSCRGVRSSLPFHTPCLYVSVFVAPSSARGVHGHRRPHRVKTPTVPVPGLVADGCTRRVSYQLAGPDGRQPNGVISFSYAFHDSRNGGDDDDGHSSDSEPVATPPSPCPTESSSSTSPLAHPLPPTTAAPRLYPAIEWPPAEQIIPIYPPPVTAEAAVTNSRYYPPPVEPVAVYPPSAGTAWSCSLYPPAGEAVPASGMYPTVDLAPVSCYPPAVYGVECGYAAAPPV